MSDLEFSVMAHGSTTADDLRPVLAKFEAEMAKVAQEKLIKAAKIPYTIVRATQFFEFVGGIAQ